MVGTPGSGTKRLTARQQLAVELADEDYELLQQLIQIRIDRGLTQVEVAELMGVTQQAISKFERMDSDPQLSSIRRYALAVGGMVSHSVSKSPA